MPRKTPALPDGPRRQWLRCRVNDAEAAAIAAWIASLDPHSAQIAGAEIAERLRTAAPFNGVGAFLRAVCGLPEIRAGAPRGNSNRNGVKKRR